MINATERRRNLEGMRPTTTPANPFLGWTWSDQDIARLRAAFRVRFDEDLPRTETLMAVAAEGIRIHMEREAEASG